MGKPAAIKEQLSYCFNAQHPLCKDMSDQYCYYNVNQGKDSFVHHDVQAKANKHPSSSATKFLVEQGVISAPTSSAAPTPKP